MREQIAMDAIKAVFQDLPSARVAEIHAMVPWSSPSDQIFAEEKSAGIDTLIFITVEELGPQLYLSIPVLWSTYSDVKFHLRAVRTQTREVILDVEHHRTVGGPFQLRGLAPLQGEMETALRDALGLGARLPR